MVYGLTYSGRLTLDASRFTPLADPDPEELEGGEEDRLKSLLQRSSLQQALALFARKCGIALHQDGQPSVCQSPLGRQFTATLLVRVTDVNIGVGTALESMRGPLGSRFHFIRVFGSPKPSINISVPGWQFVEDKSTEKMHLWKLQLRSNRGNLDGGVDFELPLISPLPMSNFAGMLRPLR